MRIGQYAMGAIGTALVATSVAVTMPSASAQIVAPGTSAKGTAASSVTPSTGRTAVGLLSTRYTAGAPYANVRTGTSTSAPVAGQLTSGQTVTGTVNGDWMKVATPTKYTGKYIHTSVLATQRVAAVSGCLSSTAHVALGVGYTLCAGDTGVKTRMVRQALGLRADASVAYGTYDSQTVNAVRYFQRTHGLYANGEMNPATYAALQRVSPGKDIAKFNFNVDGWVNPTSASLPKNATRDQRIGAMLNWAYSQVGKPYVWGGTGPTGYDCSGFVLQAMRAGGYNPKNVSNWTDVRPESDLSRQMWADREFAKGNIYNPQRGDFVYYGTRQNFVGHVGIYVGRDTVINAVGNKVQYVSYNYATPGFGTNLGWAKKVGINRAF